MNKQWYRLPNGKMTQSFDKYTTAWYKLAKPIEKKLGLRLESFDPDIRFIDKKEGFKKSIILSTWFIERFNESLKSKNKKGKYENYRNTILGA